jgi:hypothetical protein
MYLISTSYSQSLFDVSFSMFRQNWSPVFYLIAVHHMSTYIFTKPEVGGFQFFICCYTGCSVSNVLTLNGKAAEMLHRAWGETFARSPMMS